MTARKNRGTGCLLLLAGIVAYAADGPSAVVIVVVLMAATSPAARLSAVRRRLEAARTRAQRDYEQRRRAWQRRIDAHHAQHLRHNDTLDTWFPLSLASGPSRIDVFGGTGNGWASLLATVGGPLLGGGAPLVVLGPHPAGRRPRTHAKAAAQFIGQEYKFLVNQLTRQTGETLTEGRGSSYGYQRGVSDTDGSNRGGGTSGSSWGSSRSFSTSLSRGWQDSTNTSTARSTTTGENLSRVYEFAIEPTQLQALPATGLVLVETGPAGRRVVFGDCNPGDNFLPRLSARPRASLT
ncbi:hypothetical protein ABWJ92_36115 [Streptomyces sp. NPDC000609]|uniref:hypothetical protein n=1 Tax=Streptomyces sp. NPDC000609 TaxID=3160957 RepID=UPI003396AE27